MITQLEQLLAHTAAPLPALFERMFHVVTTAGHAVIPPAMVPWVTARFGSAAAVGTQQIVRVTNRFTHESALFNPLRALRPAGGRSDDAAIDAWVAAELAAGDAFADPLHATTADRFGRIVGQYAMSASNIAKYEGVHGLVIFAEPHPLRFDHAQLADYLAVALRWLAAAHAAEPQACYPMITWNCLPHSGATIAHGHMQLALAREMHYARVEAWRQVTADYRTTYAAGFCDDLYRLHAALGLALDARAPARAFAHLTPLRNREIVAFLAPPAANLAAAAPQTAGVWADLLYPILRGLIDGQGMRSFNLAIALPPFGATPEPWDDMPVIVRIADRGDPLAIRNDWGAMELYAAGCITVDPFEVAALLRDG